MAGLFDEPYPRETEVKTPAANDGTLPREKLRAQLVYQPGNTAPEYAAVINAGRIFVENELSYLESIKQVTRGEARLCRVTRTDLPTWK